MEFVQRTTLGLEFEGDGGEVRWEKPPNFHSFRVDGVDVLVKSYVTCQPETVDIVDQGEHDVGRHVLRGRKLSSTDPTDASFTRRYATGEGAEILLKFVTTGDACRIEIAPGTRGPVMPQT